VRDDGAPRRLKASAHLCRRYSRESEHEHPIWADDPDYSEFMQSQSARFVYAVDAGGSRTEVGVSRSGEQIAGWGTGSFAIASVGVAEAKASLAQLLRAISDRVGSGVPAVGCIASSSMPVADEAPLPEPLIETITRHAPTGLVILVNDVIPLLWSAPVNGVGVVVCSGTGSSVIGRDATNLWIKVGGHEHIISDQGSGYSIAREGLRSAARDADGTGPPTKLRAAAESFFGRPLPTLGRWLAEMPRPRRTVASFAPCVLGAAEEGDPIARAITESEAAALLEAVRLAVRQLSLDLRPQIGLAGGLLLESEYFRARIEQGLGKAGLTDDARRNVHLLDGLRSGTEYALRMSADSPGAGPVPHSSAVPAGRVIQIPDRG
jgi:glucosamine kinase